MIKRGDRGLNGGGKQFGKQFQKNGSGRNYINTNGQNSGDNNGKKTANGLGFDDDDDDDDLDINDSHINDSHNVHDPIDPNMTLGNNPMGNNYGNLNPFVNPLKGSRN
jgi:hypothetical protein